MTNVTQPTIKQKLAADLKASMLAGDKQRLTVIRALKSAITYAEVASGERVDPETGAGGLSDDQIIPLFAKESKKRQESAALYSQGGAQDKADIELAEKKIIDEYLPAQLGEDELTQIINETIAKLGASSPTQMGQVIGAVKAQAGATADGSLIARLVKERLSVGGGK
jgi:uncharacterized protein YqeY